MSDSSRVIWEIRALGTEVMVTDDRSHAAVSFETDRDCDYSFHLTQQQLRDLAAQIEQALSREAP